MILVLLYGLLLCSAVIFAYGCYYAFRALVPQRSSAEGNNSLPFPLWAAAVVIFFGAICGASAAIALFGPPGASMRDYLFALIAKISNLW